MEAEKNASLWIRGRESNEQIKKSRTEKGEGKTLELIWIKEEKDRPFSLHLTLKVFFIFL